MVRVDWRRNHHSISSVRVGAIFLRVFGAFCELLPVNEHRGLMSLGVMVPRCRSHTPKQIITMKRFTCMLNLIKTSFFRIEF